MGMNKICLTDDIMQLVFTYGDHVCLTSLVDLTTKHDYVSAPTAFFATMDDNEDWGCGYHTVLPYLHLSDQNLDVTLLESSETAAVLAVKSGFCPQFDLYLSLSIEKGILFSSIKAVNRTDECQFFKVQLPYLRNIVAEGDREETLVSTSQELGNLDLFHKAPEGAGIGLDVFANTGLTGGHPSLGAMTIYDPVTKNGLYFVDTTGGYERGKTPLYFASRSQILSASYSAEIKPGEENITPVLAMGFSHGQDWHAGAAYWLSLQPEVTYPAPDWLRYAGAIYANRMDGAGGAYLAGEPKYRASGRILPVVHLEDQLLYDYRKLPTLLKEAQSVGTNILYLVDWYEKADFSDLTDEERKKYADDYYHRVIHRPYWNKGDYIPRSILGGEEAFIEGIKAVHEQGGKVIVYVEPFILGVFTDAGKKHGFDWCGYHKEGNPVEAYRAYYTMLFENPEWQDYLAETCARLVGDYGIDGIFYDSMGWQWNRRMYDKDGRRHTCDENSLGLLELIRKTRAAIRAVNPEAVIMSESGSGPLLWHLDGGLSCDLCWPNTGYIKHVVSAPTRYAFPRSNLFSCGVDFNDLFQYFAAGINLALSPFSIYCMGGYPEEKTIETLHRLVSLRKEYADALIDGQLVREPQTGSVYVPSYLFNGKEYTILNICSTLDSDFDARPTLGVEYAGSKWYDCWNDREYIADADGKLLVPMKAKELAVLVK